MSLQSYLKAYLRILVILWTKFGVRLKDGRPFFFFLMPENEVLIKSIGVIPTYVMSIFRLPKRICEEITKSFARFWWGSNNKKRKIHWCKWEKICYPKSLGGLNFRDVGGFNRALLAKQMWRIIINPDSLVSRFLKAIYFKDSVVMLVELGRNSSYLWKSLVWGLELLRKGMRYRVGNGETISMFKDPLDS